MLNFDNSHIFTGYLKQFLSSFNMPTCRIYTSENQRYFELNGKEAATVIESASLQKGLKQVNLSVPYLKDGSLYTYQLKNTDSTTTENTGLEYSWRPCRNFNFRENTFIPGLTKTLEDPGSLYTTCTHEYLGDFLRFYRDSTNINLMPLYNCFSKKLCNNINTASLNSDIKDTDDNKTEIIFRASDSQYKIYMIPVKLFESYTIAIDCAQGIEMFCGLYGNDLDLSQKGKDLIRRTYQNFNQTFFNQPFLYEKLDSKLWGRKSDVREEQETIEAFLKGESMTRWDIINRERDLKLFIKIPVSNKSSIVVLEGNYLNFNDCKYEISENRLSDNDNEDEAETVYTWAYSQNTFISNFEKTTRQNSDYLPILSERPFKPVGKLQLLAINTGTSYPFSNRLIEYLSNNVITPEDTISDNIRRVQKVMENNGYLFSIPGVWEPSMQKIIYDYLRNDGPYTIINKNKKSKSLPQNDQIKNGHKGLHTTIGHNNRDSYYDVLGFVDKDAEKFYASWKVATEKTENDGLKITSITPTTVQNVDIYNNLYKED